MLIAILISRWLVTYPPEVAAAWAAYDRSDAALEQ